MKRSAVLASLILLTQSCTLESPVNPSTPGLEMSHDFLKFSHVVDGYKVSSVDDSDYILRKTTNQKERVVPNQLLIHLTKTDISKLLKDWDMTLIERQKFPSKAPEQDMKTGKVTLPDEASYTYTDDYIVTANNTDAEDVTDFDALAQENGMTGPYNFSSNNSVGLLHRLLRMRKSYLIQGETASLNARMEKMDVSNEGAYKGTTTSVQSPSTLIWYTYPVSYGYGADFNEPFAGGRKVWSYASAAAGQNVAVIDAGFVGAGESFSTQIFGGSGSVSYYNFDSSNHTDITGPDPVGAWHGRSVSSLIFAPDNDYAGVVGAAPRAKPYLLVATTQASVTSAISQATAWGCRVANISLGFPDNVDYSGKNWSMYTTVQNTSQAGMICVCAAGNTGYQTNIFPAAYSQYNYVISVGAHNKYGSRSGWPGGLSSNTAFVDIYAPGGGGIVGSSSSGYGYDDVSASDFGNPTYTFDYFMGTSAASPLAAGVVACMKNEGRANFVTNAKSWLQSHHTNYPVGPALDAILATQ